MSERNSQIAKILERLYERYNHKEFIPPDPLQFVYQYSDPADMEIAGFLSAALAYGRVGQISKSLTDLLGRMGNSPCQFVCNFTADQRAGLRDFKHRFTTGDDISDLLELLKIVLESSGSIEKFFAKGYSPNDENIISALTTFCDSLAEIYTAKHNRPLSRGLGYLMSNPSRGSACKRLNLFLRWMVRDDDIDTGLWRSIDKAKLLIPADVHMLRLTRILKFHDQKTASLAAVIKITKGFAGITPDDPVKYDFSLSRIGIVENCTGQLTENCSVCELFKFCC